ncbi:MAG: collagen binding domain-containing protein, partial [Acidimicrobiales bacterium]
MNRRPMIYIGLVILVFAGAGFAYFNGSGHDPDPGAQITVFTEDLQNNPLSGVEIQVLDEKGNSIDTKTTKSSGEVIVNLGNAAATYRIVAPNPPTGYVNHSDSDAGLVLLNGVTCATPTACLFYVVDANGTVIAGNDVNLDSGQGTITFMSAVAENEEAIFVEPGTDEDAVVLPDELVGDAICDGSCDDESGSVFDDEFAAGDLDGYLLIGGDPRIDESYVPRTQLVCPAVVHRPSDLWPLNPSFVEGGFWISGPPGYITITGDGINGGSPVTSNPFDGGPIFIDLPIDSYGDKQITGMTHTAADGTVTDLMPTFTDAWTGPFTVTGSEGPLDENPLCEILRENSGDLDGYLLIDKDTKIADSYLPQDEYNEFGNGPSDLPLSRDFALEATSQFVQQFSDAQYSRNVDFLVGSLHPVAIEAYGQQACENYVAATVGSIQNVQLVSLGELTEYSYETDAGPWQLPNAW